MEMEAPFDGLLVEFTNKAGKNSRYFVGVFVKTIIPLALVGYEMIIANSYPTCTRGVIVKENTMDTIASSFP